MNITKTNPGAFGTRVNNKLVIISFGDNEIDDVVWKGLKEKDSICEMIFSGEIVVSEKFIIEEEVIISKGKPHPYELDEDEYEDFNAATAIEYIESIDNKEELLAVYKLESNDKERKTVLDKIYQIADELEIDIEE